MQQNDASDPLRIPGDILEAVPMMVCLSLQV